MSKQKRRPSYLLHRQTGQARTKIGGRLHYLGVHGSKESRERYEDLIREWALTQEGDQNQLTLDDLALLFLDHAAAHYRHPDGTPTRTAENIRFALRPLIARHGRTRVRDFGPRALKEVRQAMIDAGHSRTYINGMIGKIKRMFRWGVEEEFVPATVYQAQAAVSGLRAGRSHARETAPVPPVPEGTVNDTLPHLPRVVADMVRLQLLTGMRPGEVCTLRPCDITRGTNGVWTYRPERHKTEHHGRKRRIFIGPEGQKILGPYLDRDPEACCFSPAESEADRNAARKAARLSPMTPSQAARRNNSIPSSVACLIYDATTTPDQLLGIVPGPIVDITPAGRVELRHQVVQDTGHDITRSTKAEKVVNILRALIAEAPDLQHGVVCHQTHYRTVTQFAAENGLIAQVAYFGSGEERSSNEWINGNTACDRLVILGTPRPGPAAVRAELVRLGNLEAAAIEQPEWTHYGWRGWDRDGEPLPQVITTKGYSDPAWQSAFRAICWSTLIQAAGRGRGALDAGIPVVVVTREPIGLPVRNAGRSWMTAEHAATLEIVTELSQPCRTNSDTISKAIRTPSLRNIYYGMCPSRIKKPVRNVLGDVSESRPVPTGKVAAELRDKFADNSRLATVTVRTVHRWLTALEQAGLVSRPQGNRGWIAARHRCGDPIAHDSQVANEPVSASNRELMMSCQHYALRLRVGYPP